jgi:hypothetical protein
MFISSATKTTRQQDLENSATKLEDLSSQSEIQPNIDMATKTLEARFEHLSVNDENEPAQNGSTMLKSKVLASVTQVGIYQADCF